MKYSVALVAGAVAGASAQASYSTIYEYYSDCGTTTIGPLSTSPGTLTYSIPNGVTYSSPNMTGTTTEVVTVCPTCMAKPELYPEGKSVELTTYTTVYSCPGPSGMEGKIYTITEPCPTPGIPHTPGYIPQNFTVTTVKCTACPGSPNVAVTTPIAQKTAPPGTPGSSSPGAPVSGSSSPGAPGSGSPPGTLGSGSSSPGAPGTGSSSPGAQGSGSSSPGALGSGSSPGAPSSGSSSPGTPGSGSGSLSPGAPGSGSSSLGSPGSGSSSPGASGAGSSSLGAPGSPAAAVGNAAPPYPIPGASEAHGGTALSSSGVPSGGLPTSVPFKGAATKMVTTSLLFAVGVAGFIGFYLI